MPFYSCSCLSSPLHGPTEITILLPEQQLPIAAVLRASFAFLVLAPADTEAPGAKLCLCPAIGREELLQFTPTISFLMDTAAAAGNACLH